MDTMNTIFFDSNFTDGERREALYKGQLFVYSPVPSSAAFCEFARDMVHEAFDPLDPTTAQFQMRVEDYAAVLAELKPKFIHHPKSKEFIQNILGELGCDLERVYFDVPRLRTSTSDNYLTSGIAYAFHPHRDTWYSAPFCQINWWMPVFDVRPDNVMAFHPKYWSQGILNGSAKYNYYQWNQQSRKDAAKHVKSDTREQPRPEEPMELDPQLRVVCNVGGVILFSAAQMHSSVPNTSGRTRFSIDFRTVHLDDALARRGARNIDSACTGTTMRDHLRGSDFSHLSNEVIALYDDETTSSGELLYRPAPKTEP